MRVFDVESDGGVREVPVVPGPPLIGDTGQVTGSTTGLGVGAVTGSITGLGSGPSTGSTPTTAGEDEGSGHDDGPSVHGRGDAVTVSGAARPTLSHRPGRRC